MNLNLAGNKILYRTSSLKVSWQHTSDCCDHSAGVGRTGCFIVIDAMLERIKHEKTVDIYGHVTLMRAQRNYMVQTEDQYVFIHDALQEAVNCGTTEVPARNLYAYIQKLTQIEGGENVTGMELEFKVQIRTCLKSVVPVLFFLCIYL